MSRRLRPTIAVLALAVLAPFAGSSAAEAAPKQFLSRAKDPVGDGPRPSLDIYETLARYKSDGSILFVVSLAGPIDPVGSDAGVTVSLGSTCKNLLGIGAGLLSKPDTVQFIPEAKKKLKTRSGQGEITNNVFTFLVKHPTLAGWDPKCYAVGLVNPADEKAAPYDVTDEIELAPRS